MIEVKPLQSQKQPSPNNVTEEGMEIEVKPLQSSKQLGPISVTPEGMVKLVKPLQPLKADSPIEVTPEGMVNVVVLFLMAGYLNGFWRVGLLQVGLILI